MNQAIKDYFISRINEDTMRDQYGITDMSEGAKLSFLSRVFHSEYCYEQNIKRYRGNIAKIFSEWIKGLPSAYNSHYWNEEIVSLGVLFDLIPANADEDAQCDFIDRFWDIQGQIFVELTMNVPAERIG